MDPWHLDMKFAIDKHQALGFSTMGAEPRYTKLQIDEDYRSQNLRAHRNIRVKVEDDTESRCSAAKDSPGVQLVSGFGRAEEKGTPRKLSDLQPMEILLLRLRT